MKIESRLYFDNAIKVSDSLLVTLEEELGPKLGECKYRIKTLDRKEISFESREELLSFNNIGDDKIYHLKMVFDNPNRRLDNATIEFSSYNFVGSIKNKGFALFSFETDNRNDAAFFKEIYLKLLESNKLEYNWIIKYSFLMNIVISVIFASIGAMLFLMIFKQFSNEYIIPIYCVFGFAMYGIAAFLVEKSIKFIFNPVVFLIGKQAEEYNSGKKNRGNILWAVIGAIISIILTAIIGLIFK